LINTDKQVYQPGESVTVNFENGPGTSADWIGIFRQNAPPGTAPLLAREYIKNLQSGDIVFNLYLDTGQFYASMYINNSNVRISNKASFNVESGTDILNSTSGQVNFTIFPSPSDGRLRIFASHLQDKDLSLRISSITGELVYEKNSSVSSAEFCEEIDLSDNDPGIYLVYIISGDQVFVKKLVLN
jgi:hypothetical protein